MRRFVQNSNFLGFVLALLALALYLRTLASTVTLIDSGELAAVATTLGIAHPTGYPLFTLIGWVFAHVPLGLRTIVQLNMMSAFCCSLGVFFFFKLFVFLLRDQSEKSLVRTSVPAATGTLALAFSETFWSQAISIEVYSLHILLLSVVLLLFLKALDQLPESVNSTEGSSSSKSAWYGFAFALGLSFTNHMTTVLLAPGFLYLFFTTHRFSRAALGKLVRAISPFLLGLSLYLYLPVRAAQQPLLNCGNTTTPENFWWHVSGKQYRVWILSSTETAVRQFKYFLESFPSEIAYLPLLLALLGVIYLYRWKRGLFYFILILFLSCVLYSINYDIHDIDSYFLLAYVVTAIWTVFGAKVVLDLGVRYRKAAVSAFVCLAVGLTPLFLHYERMDESHNYAVEDYTKNMFDCVETDALVLSYQWDYFVSPSSYFQLVEGHRKDVVVIDKELLRRSWYFKQLEHQHPQLIEKSRREVDDFLKELYKFEHNLPYDPVVIQARFESMIQGFLLENYHTRPVYVTSEIEPEFLRGFQKVPSGLAFRLYQDILYHPITSREFSFRPITKSDKYSEMVRNLYATAYTNQGIYLALGGKKEEAIELLKKAVQINPRSPDALVWLQRLDQ